MIGQRNPELDGSPLLWGFGASIGQAHLTCGPWNIFLQIDQNFDCLVSDLAMQRKGKTSDVVIWQTLLDRVHQFVVEPWMAWCNNPLSQWHHNNAGAMGCPDCLFKGSRWIGKTAWTFQCFFQAQFFRFSILPPFEGVFWWPLAQINK